ncbi:hypothetical protein [Pseudoalteromonas sp. S16_S37]|uniref:hypothetical protein n=1 Tax=Pseudoalteromonas sp. S16_S37 TaxID=2720228 RepID=UPI0016814AC9|nr:hypothetical protein [Pseudoalteromonas sp. S16_S37]MBD1581142.1 hypothetical protein [Pseudoalteromonas sp. S16_S37]
MKTYVPHYTARILQNNVLIFPFSFSDSALPESNAQIEANMQAVKNYYRRRAGYW